MTNCETFQERLAEIGPEAAETDAELRAHLPGCADCSKFLDDLRQVESDLRALGDVDAPDELVAKTLRAVQDAAANDPSISRSSGARRWFAGGLAGAVAVAASLVLVLNLPVMDLVVSRQVAHRADQEGGVSYYEEQFAAVESGEKDANGPAASPPEGSFMLSDPVAPSRETAGVEASRRAGADNKNEESFDMAELSEPAVRQWKRGKSDAPTDDSFRDVVEPEQEALDRRADRDSAAQSVDEMELAPGTAGNRVSDKGASSVPAEILVEPKTKPEGRYREGADDVVIAQDYAARKSAPETVVPLSQPEPSDFQREEFAEKRVSTIWMPDEFRAVEPGVGNRELPNSIVTGEANAHLEAQDKELAGAGDAIGLTSKSVAADPPVSLGGGLLSDESSTFGAELRGNLESDQSAGSSLLSRYTSMEQLVFQEPTGYWANTYIPGDPAMRLLAARLAVWDRRPLGRELRLEQAVQPVAQPFDLPTDAAVAVYLSADQASIDGPTRMRVQVGLKGAERQGGRRPAMNIGLVIDLRDPTDLAEATRVRALIEALERARQPEDRFSLTVAGPNGGLLVEPEQFRHGPIRVAIESLFGDASDRPTDLVDLHQALTLATDTVLAGDDPTAVLGSSLVLLVTGSSLADDLSNIETFAHRNAVGGVPTSVISLGAGRDFDHIDRLVAAGQGNRRILATAQAAETVIDHELHAASRAVARALRLRIRLAPGVQLVDVLGSRRLAEPMAARVREAEQSIDQRLARNLGITADRGEDEDGIQIVIPNFYAGDDHVILLDVVADGPGPIADVRVRYKDVAHLRNGVAEASLTVGNEGQQVGPLERNVLQNLVAWELSRLTRDAGRALAGGNVAHARTLIATLRAEIQDIRGQITGWPNDPILIADQSVLDDFATALNTPAAIQPNQLPYLSDSLTYAAFRKLQPARP